MFALDLMLFGFGAIMIFVNFISLRQAVTPPPMLGRMTSTMRWLILIPAGPGALIGGWLGQHAGLRASLIFAAIGGLLVTLSAWRSPTLRAIKTLPALDSADASLASELMRP
jgi:MFS family permease